MQRCSHSNHKNQCCTPLCKIFLEVKLLLHEIKLNYCFNMFWTPFEHTRSKQFSCLRHNSYLKANVRISCWRTVKQTNKYLQLTNADKLKIMVNTIKLLKECYVITSFLLWYDAISLMMNYFNKKKYILDRLRFRLKQNPGNHSIGTT